MVLFLLINILDKRILCITYVFLYIVVIVLLLFVHFMTQAATALNTFSENYTLFSDVLWENW